MTTVLRYLGEPVFYYWCVKCDDAWVSELVAASQLQGSQIDHEQELLSV